MKSRSICLSISKRNEDMVDVIDEYADMLGMSKACAVFHIIKDYNRLKLKERINGFCPSFIHPLLPAFSKTPFRTICCLLAEEGAFFLTLPRYSVMSSRVVFPPGCLYSQEKCSTGVFAPNSGRTWFQRRFLYSLFPLSFAEVQSERNDSHACSRVGEVIF